MNNRNTPYLSQNVICQTYACCQIQKKKMCGGIFPLSKRFERVKGGDSPDIHTILEQFHRSVCGTDLRIGYHCTRCSYQSETLKNVEQHCITYGHNLEDSVMGDYAVYMNKIRLQFQCDDCDLEIPPVIVYNKEDVPHWQAFGKRWHELQIKTREPGPLPHGEMRAFIQCQCGRDLSAYDVDDHFKVKGNEIQCMPVSELQVQEHQEVQVPEQQQEQQEQEKPQVRMRNRNLMRQQHNQRAASLSLEPGAGSTEAGTAETYPFQSEEPLPDFKPTRTMQKTISNKMAIPAFFVIKSQCSCEKYVLQYDFTCPTSYDSFDKTSKFIPPANHLCETGTPILKAKCLFPGCEFNIPVTRAAFGKIEKHMEVHPETYPPENATSTKDTISLTPNSRFETDRITGDAPYEIDLTEFEMLPSNPTRTVPTRDKIHVKENIRLECKSVFHDINEYGNYGTFPTAFVQNFELGEIVSTEENELRHIYLKRAELKRLLCAITRKINYRMPADKESLLICGSPGSGKSLSCYASALHIFRFNNGITIAWVSLPRQRNNTKASCVILWHSQNGTEPVWNVKTFEFDNNIGGLKNALKDEILMRAWQPVVLFVDGVRSKEKMGVSVFATCGQWRNSVGDHNLRHTIFVSSNFYSLMENSDVAELEPFFYLSWTEGELVGALDNPTFLRQVYGNICSEESGSFRTKYYDRRQIQRSFDQLRDDAETTLRKQFLKTGTSARAAFLDYEKVVKELDYAVDKLRNHSTLISPYQANVLADECIHLCDRLFACHSKNRAPPPPDTSNRRNVDIFYLSHYVKEAAKLVVSLEDLNRFGRSYIDNPYTLCWLWEDFVYQSLTVQPAEPFVLHMFRSDVEARLQVPQKRETRQSVHPQTPEQKERERQILEERARDVLPLEWPKTNAFYLIEYLKANPQKNPGIIRYDMVIAELLPAFAMRRISGVTAHYYLQPVRRNHPGFDLAYIYVSGGAGSSSEEITIYFVDMTVSESKSLDKKLEEIPLFLTVASSRGLFNLASVKEIEFILLAPNVLVNRVIKPVEVGLSVSNDLRGECYLEKDVPLTIQEIEEAFISGITRVAARLGLSQCKPRWRLTRRYSLGFAEPVYTEVS